MSIVPYLSNGNHFEITSSLLLYSLVPTVVMIVLGLILWIGSGKISFYIVPENELEKECKEINYKELQVLTFSVVGLIILTNVLPNIIEEISNLILLKKNYALTNFNTRFKAIFNMIELIVEVIIGLLLLIKSRGIVVLLKKVQNAGVNK
ncbi:hypothetical protein [Sporosalibacterium faouarense]|uniref:hypothetical protein n=1 Tax=Sporosalibacterium faouarense TaxID=516123 RepID=UPI00192C36CB|nr:hypothetical protein [Sporosalibacterium faouarense]